MVKFVPAILVATAILASCTSSDGKYTFRNTNDALADYHQFLEETRKLDKCSAKQLATTIHEWTEFRDTLYNYIDSDTSFHIHNMSMNAFIHIDDSIKIELYRNASSSDRSLSDVFNIKSQTSLQIDKEIVSQSYKYEVFFESVDSVALPKSNATATLANYRKFLRNAQQTDLSDIGSIEKLVKEEDVLFRTYLLHINEYSDVNLADITSMTEKMCEEICHSAIDKHIDTNAVVVLMSMRANRRLIQNAQACLASINRHDHLDESQKMAYFWMLVQPYLSIDRMGMSLLTKSQRKQMETLATSIRKIEAASVLGSRNEKVARVSDLILKLYISTL